MGASKWVSLAGSAEGRARALASKRAVAEARLAYARRMGDARLVAQEEARLVRIAQWERES